MSQSEARSQAVFEITTGEALDKKVPLMRSNSAMNAAGNIRPLMDEIRVYADILETEIFDKMWPLPKYREMLFIK
jgi:glutamine synthetase